MGWDKCHLWDLSSEGSGRTRFTKLVHIRIWNTKITVKIYLRSNISPSYRFRSHRNICLLVTVISLEKMLPRHKTMFVVVSAGVWGKNSLKNWCRYWVQLALPSFFCTPPSVRDSLFVFASFLPLFVGKAQNIAPVLRVTGVFSCIFFFTPPRAWLALHGRFTLASVWPKNAEKLRLFCRSRPPQWN